MDEAPSSRWRTTTVAAALGLIVLVSCTSGGSRPASTGPPANSTPQAFAGLAPCENSSFWLCGSIEVPLDRSDPSGEQIEIAFYVHPHSDTSTPPAEPVFVTPGGPGASGWEAKDPISTIDEVTAHHDIVAIDSRGTGASGAIDCKELQSGFSSLRELRRDVTRCGAQLGDAADRYGGGDVAMDVDAVREELGFEAIDYYAFSFATVDVQAYAARFPDHVHAVVLDSGLPATDPGHAFFWGLGVPEALVHVPALICERDPACAADFPDAERDLRRLIAEVGRRPLVGRDADAAGIPKDLVVDQTTLAFLIGPVAPPELLAAAAALEDGDPVPLLRLGQLNPPFIPQGDGLPTEFSTGDNAARACNDLDPVWDRSDPPAARETSLARALGDQPRAAFAPFTKQAWNEYWAVEMCLGWPSPDRFEPAVPEGAVFTGLPTLILAGDLDTSVSTEISGALLTEFPNATFVLVRDAGHITIQSSPCAVQLVANFVHSLDVSETTCAGPQPPPDA